MIQRRPIANSGGRSTGRDDVDERLAYIAVALIPGVGARRLASLISALGSAQQVIRAPRRLLAEIPGVPLDIVTAISRIRLGSVSRLLDRQRDRGAVVVVPGDAEFPVALRSIPDPPTLLWLRGQASVLQHEAVAIVGSRDHSAYGARIAELLARAAAESGITVVSGMARGLDAVAHAAALDAGFTTIGVLANGVDVVYPVSNRALYERVTARGLLLSEHPPAERAHSAAFPRRNRLVSGLARAVVVVEAADGSGTMLTVTSALEQGREVLAVPGPIDSATSRGTNRLIRDGAVPLVEVDQLLSLFGVARPAPAALDAGPPCTLSPVEAMVFNALSDGGRAVDELALHAGLPVGVVLGALLGLELGGVAEQVSGGLYRRRRC